MSRVESMISMLVSRKASVAVGIAIIFIVIIDLLTTRQILPYNNDTEAGNLYFDHSALVMASVRGSF